MDGETVFRHSPARALVAACVILASAAGLVVWARLAHAWLAYYLAAVLVIGLVVLRRLVLARFAPSNWLVRVRPDGVFVQFRSYLNQHFSEQDVTVVFIPRGEIRAVRLVRERRDIPDRDDSPRRTRGVTRQTRRLVELELAGDTGLLARALADESARRARGTTYRDYPARLVAPATLELEWSVVPSGDVFLRSLAGRVAVAPTVDREGDYTALATLGADEQRRRLRELAQTGQTMTAIHLARRLYGYDLAEARSLIERLRAETA